MEKEVEANYGLTIMGGQGMARISMGCPHQRGLMYIIPAEKSWVCSEELMPGHALAGFLRELTSQKDERTYRLMQQWGIYFRELPLEEQKEGT